MPMAEETEGQPRRTRAKEATVAEAVFSSNKRSCLLYYMKIGIFLY